MKISDLFEGRFKQGFFEKKIDFKIRRQKSIYSAPEMYDEVYNSNSADVDFYKNLKKGKILYLGPGTGRLFRLIAQKNKDLLGLDNSVSMMRLFRKKYPNFYKQLVHGDALNDACFKKNTFDIIVAPHSFCTQFSAEQNKKLLSNVFRWLKPGGRFITDQFSPFQNPPFNIGTEIYKKGRLKSAQYIQILLYSFIEQQVTEKVIWKEDGTYSFYSINLHYYYPQEFQRLMTDAGFKAVYCYGDFSKHSPTIKSKTILFSGEKT